MSYNFCMFGGQIDKSSTKTLWILVRPRGPKLQICGVTLSSLMLNTFLWFGKFSTDFSFLEIINFNVYQNDST